MLALSRCARSTSCDNAIDTNSTQLYTDAIKRNPDDARGYTNRAAAYTKLLALSEALKDSESAIKADPKFVKGYIRKSHVRFAMKEYDKALEAITEARTADVERKNAKEIDQQERKCFEAQFGQQANETDEERLSRAMRDPEVQQIMSDPAMQSVRVRLFALWRASDGLAQILQQAQENPAALNQCVHSCPSRPMFTLSQTYAEPCRAAKDHEVRSLETKSAHC